MNKFVKLSTIALATAALAAPALAAPTSLIDSNAIAKANAASSEHLISLLGFSGGNTAEQATTVRIIDVSEVYGGQTREDIEDALIVKKRYAVDNLRTKLAGGNAVGAFLRDNNIDTNSVLAVENDGSTVNVYVS